MTSWTIQSMEFSRPDNWSGYLFPSPEDLPNAGIELGSPAGGLQVDSSPTEIQGSPEVKVKVAQLCPVFCKPMDCSLLSSWNSPGKNTGVGSCSLLQGIFPTQELNPGLPHCRQIPTIRVTREALERHLYFTGEQG